MDMAIAVTHRTGGCCRFTKGQQRIAHSSTRLES
jgi:hypothetical protein